MDRQKNSLLTPNELTYFILSFVVGTGIMKLPNDLVETAGQDAWISAVLAFLYPLFVVLIASYIIKKHPKENILFLNKKYFGNIFGIILNIILLMQFLIMATAIISNVIALTGLFMVSFLSDLKIAIVITFLAAFGAYKGLKVLSKISQLTFYLFVITILFTLLSLKDSSFLNIQPIFGSGINNILETSKTSAFALYGWEALFLFYPYVEDVKKVKKAALKAVGLCGILYFWVVMVSILYLGIGITTHSFWSLVLVFESIHIPVINNFRYVFMFIWTLIGFRVSANYYYAVAFNLSDIIKVDIKKICIFIYPLILYISIIFTNGILKDRIVGTIIPLSIAFNFGYFTLLALLIYKVYSKK